MVQPQQAAELRPEGAAQDAGQDDGGGGQGGRAPGSLADGDAHRGGDALGQQGEGQHSVQAAEGRQAPDAAQAGQRAGRHAGQDGGQVPAQPPELGVQRDGQADGGRGQQPGKGFAVPLIGLVGDAGGRQRRPRQNGCNQDGVEDGQPQ